MTLPESLRQEKLAELQGKQVKKLQGSIAGLFSKGLETGSKAIHARIFHLFYTDAVIDMNKGKVTIDYEKLKDIESKVLNEIAKFNPDKTLTDYMDAHKSKTKP